MSYWGAFELTQQLDDALSSRATIEQAKGVLMATTPGLYPEGAFDLLRRASQRENIKLRVIARRIVEQRTPDPALPTSRVRVSPPDQAMVTVTHPSYHETRQPGQEGAALRSPCQSRRAMTHVAEAVEFDRSGDHLTVYIGGRLDGSSVERIEASIASHIHSTDDVVWLDLEAVTFCGSLGVTMLLRIRNHVDQLGARVDALPTVTSRPPYARALRARPVLLDLAAAPHVQLAGGASAPAHGSGYTVRGTSAGVTTRWWAGRAGVRRMPVACWRMW